MATEGKKKNDIQEQLMQVNEHLGRVAARVSQLEAVRALGATETLESAPWVPRDAILFPGWDVDDPETYAKRVQTRDKLFSLISRWLADQMQEGVHWYPTKRVDRDTGEVQVDRILKKSGAELIRTRLGLYPRIVIDDQVQALCHEEGGPLRFAVIAELVNAWGQVVSVGRGVGETRPNPPGRMKGGMNPNAAIKMAQKSALIDAALNLGFSDLFVQDPEEGAPGGSSEAQDGAQSSRPPTRPQRSQRRHEVPPAKPQLPSEPGDQVDSVRETLKKEVARPDKLQQIRTYHEFAGGLTPKMVEVFKSENKKKLEDLSDDGLDRIIHLVQGRG